MRERLERATLENSRLAAENEKLGDEIKIGHDELERTMTQKIEASKIKHSHRDKERVSYHKDSLDVVRNIAIDARKDREDAEWYYRRATFEKKDAEILKADYETGTQLKEEYEKKLSGLEEQIETRARALADERFERFVSYSSKPDMTRAMEEFMAGFEYGGKGHTLLDEFYGQYERYQEKMARDWEDDIWDVDLDR